MKKITLNIDNLSTINFNSNIITDILTYSDLIPKMRYADSIGKPWGEWDRVCSFLEKEAIKLNYNNLTMFNKVNDLSYKINFLYVFSEFSYKNKDLILEIFKHINKKQAIYLLSREHIAKILLENILSNPKLSLNLKIDNFILFLLRARTLELESKDEVNLISLYLKKNELRHGGGIDNIKIRKSLENRLISLTSKTNYIEIKKDKLAVFINGQVRDFEKNINSINKTLSSINIDFDIYISTWRNVGKISIENNRLEKYISSYAINHITKKFENNDIRKKIEEFYKQVKLDKVTEKSITDNLSNLTYEKIFINIKNDYEFPYNKMNNPEKMYYHNCFWIKTLGKKHFADYSHILKIRPDIEFTFSDIDNLLVKNQEIITEEKNGWIFREWGFGIGDQVIVGYGPDILELLDVYGNKDIEYLCSYLFNTDTYKGHINLGLLAWENNYNVKNNNVFNTKIISNQLDDNTVLNLFK